MQRKARVLVTIKPDVLDPAGVSVKKLLHRQGFKTVQDVRIGKVIDVIISDAKSSETNASMMKEIAHLLSNDIVENYTVSLVDET